MNITIMTYLICYLYVQKRNIRMHIIVHNQLNSHINEEIDEDLMWFCHDRDSLLSTLLFWSTFDELLVLGLVL